MTAPKEAIIKFFEHLYNRYNTKEYIQTDPVRFPHELAGNTEFIAFTSALFAYGNMKAMQTFLRSFFESCGTAPLTLRDNPLGLKYRFQSADDLSVYLETIKRIYLDYGSVEALFQAEGKTDLHIAAAGALQTIRNEYLPAKLTHGLNFLFAMPGKSASKRLAMYLRWMVRKDEVDLGLWTAFPKTSLSVPLDTHIHKMACRLGIITAGDSAVKGLQKVNLFFQKISPDDPVKYDFALTRKGIVFRCPYEPSTLCASCRESDFCVFN